MLCQLVKSRKGEYEKENISAFMPCLVVNYVNFCDRINKFYVGVGTAVLRGRVVEEYYNP